MTLDDITRIIPNGGLRAGVFLEPLNAAMAEFGIDTPLRQAAFLAQVAHESGGLRYVRELASGEAYEGRADLGNSQTGDGVRFKGRGLIQITGRSNYRDCSIALFGYADRLLSEPTLLEQPNMAARSAAWFWKRHNLNELADANSFRAITRAINGGFNGLTERLAYYARAREVLSC